jgi:alditol oxidase
MNKRIFIKLFAAALASPPAMRVLAWAGHERLRNWAGNIEYSTDRVQASTSLKQVQDYVKAQRKLKVLGTRHCFNHIADSKDAFLSLKPMDNVITIDPAKREIVIADGKVVNLSRERDPETFSGAVVGLGALGVITKVTLDIQPSFMMRQYVYENLPLSELKDHFDAIESSGYSVSLFTDWQKQRINELWIKTRVEERQAFHAIPEFFGAKLATRNVHPIAALSAENCTEQMGVPGPWYERLPHFRMGFTPSAGKELQSEYFVPRQHAVEAILAVERLRNLVSPSLLITEIRTIAADNLWMSPCYQQDCVTIHFTWKPDWPAVSKLLPVIEREVAPFNARPHWGKLFTMSPAELKRIYKKMPDFIELSKRHDPQGKFRNEYLNKNIFDV